LSESLTPAKLVALINELKNARAISALIDLIESGQAGELDSIRDIPYAYQALVDEGELTVEELGRRYQGGEPPSLYFTRILSAIYFPTTSYFLKKKVADWAIDHATDDVAVSHLSVGLMTQIANTVPEINEDFYRIAEERLIHQFPTFELVKLICTRRLPDDVAVLREMAQCLEHIQNNQWQEAIAGGYPSLVVIASYIRSTSIVGEISTLNGNDEIPELWCRLIDRMESAPKEVINHALPMLLELAKLHLCQWPGDGPVPVRSFSVALNEIPMEIWSSENLGRLSTIPDFNHVEYHVIQDGIFGGTTATISNAALRDRIRKISHGPHTE